MLQNNNYEVREIIYNEKQHQELCGKVDSMLKMRSMLMKVFGCVFGLFFVIMSLVEPWFLLVFVAVLIAATIILKKLDKARAVTAALAKKRYRVQRTVCIDRRTVVNRKRSGRGKKTETYLTLEGFEEEVFVSSFLDEILPSEAVDVIDVIDDMSRSVVPFKNRAEYGLVIKALEEGDQ